MKAKIPGLLAVALLAGPFAAHAGLLTTNNLASPTTLNFNQFAFNPLVNVSAPIQVGSPVGEDIVFSGSPNSGLYAYNGTWSLASNGQWNVSQIGYLGVNNARPGSLIITFNDGAVSSVGAFMNHDPGVADLIISAFNGATLLETYNITDLANISTPFFTNGGAFRGIQRNANDITSFSVFGYVPVLDNLSFNRVFSRVPEPGTLMLLGLGLLGLGVSRRKV